MKLIPASVQLVIKKALADVIDTFYTATIVLHQQRSTLDQYGEKPVKVRQDTTLRCYFEYSVGISGNYSDIEKTDMGQRYQPGWRVYLWKDDVDAFGIDIDPEQDKVTIQATVGAFGDDGFGESGFGGSKQVPKTFDYDIRMFSPSALFADLGFLMYVMELKET